MKTEKFLQTNFNKRLFLVFKSALFLIISVIEKKLDRNFFIELIFFKRNIFFVILNAQLGPFSSCALRNTHTHRDMHTHTDTTL